MSLPRLAFVLALLPPALVFAAVAPPSTVILSPSALAEAKERLQAGDKTTAAALAAVCATADAALDITPPSVVKKTAVAANGDRHDYFSFGPYWWPDPHAPKGLPYIRRDGAVNPESVAGTDWIPLMQMGDTVKTLGLAYHFTGRETYAATAAKWVRVWFLDPATRMNPNLNHAQAIPGITDGRGIGIIEGRYVSYATEAVSLIRASDAWSKTDDEAFRSWMEAYYQWLRTSKNGLDEKQELNNHGSWYDAQTAQLALWLGRTDEAREIIQSALQTRLATQVEPDGQQPRELARTRSLDYSLFNLEALFQLARTGERVGVDWWRYETSDGRSILKAMRFLAPYADPEKKWFKEEVVETKRVRLLPLLVEAARHSDDPLFTELLTRHLTPEATRAQWQLYR